MRNVGSFDRMLRVIIGLGILSLVFIGPQTLWGWLGLILIITGLMGWCPLYRVAGMSTCPVNKMDSRQH